MLVVTTSNRAPVASLWRPSLSRCPDSPIRLLLPLPAGAGWGYART